MISKSSLNHIYRSVWNEALGAMVAVAELAPARGKAVSSVSGAPNAQRTLSSLLRAPSLGITALLVALAWNGVASPVWANPTGAVAISGQASLTNNGNQLLVTTQNAAGTNNSAINWQSFSIPTGSSTYFLQPNASSTSINRVVTNTPSLIFGTLGSNGNLVLVNQSGITVGAGAVVDTAGFTASALNMTDADAIAGRLRFGNATVPGGNVQVQGSVLARSGDVVLLGSNVLTGSNALVQAPNGNTILAAGQSIEITARGLEGISLQVQAPTNSAVNLGTLTGDAVGIFAGTLTHSGTIQANAVSTAGGKVVLQALQQADVAGTVTAKGINGTNGGSIDVSVAHSTDPANPGALIQSGALNASGTSGVGGAVHLNADAMLLSGAITADGAAGGGQIVVQAQHEAWSTTGAVYSASSTGGAGGTILVDGGVSNYTSGQYSATGLTGGNVTLAGQTIDLAATQANASGIDGGGTIHVGGLMHGAAGFSAAGADLSNASNVYANDAVVLKADALASGNGGEIVMWADDAMRAAGTLSAKGGAIGGNGGQAEVSGLQSMGYRATADLSASHGSAGTLLMDPKNITVVSGNGGWGGLPTYQEILDPSSEVGEGFGGYSNLVMPISGSIVVSSPLDSSLGTYRGAVFFFSSTGALNATLVGYANNDEISSGGLTSLASDKVLISSPLYGSAGTAANALGAITWANGQTGALSNGSVGGTVSSANSLVGATAGDQIGSGGITQVSGNVLISSPNWANGASYLKAGAVTWMSGSTGMLVDGVSYGGAVSAANSLVGTSAMDQVGLGGITQLSSGNVVIASPQWGGGGVPTSAYGAVTWMSGSNGWLSNGNSYGTYGGAVTASNSLVGATAGDRVGSGGIVQVGSGNVLIGSPNYFDVGNSNASAGAVTWMNGADGTLAGGTATGGTVSTSNSLVGSYAGDQVGSPGFYSSPDGINLLIHSTNWNGGYGALTWMSGSTGALSDTTYGGYVGASNSLLGSAVGDNPGNGNVIVLPINGNWLISSSYWGSSRGAVTWMNSANGQLSDYSYGGTLGTANSLVGTTANDRVGAGGVFTLSDYSTFGNALIASPYWSAQAGAVTWINGVNGQLVNSQYGGQISSTNSLVGQLAGSGVGNSINVLGNGNVIVGSPYWGNGTTTPLYAGAVTWMNGSNGLLSDGNDYAGTYGAIVTSNNSLLGSYAGDYVGLYGVNYNYTTNNVVVVSPYWSNGGVTPNAGAITVISGGTGMLGSAYGGVVSSANSLVSDQSNTSLSPYGVQDLQNGKVVIAAPSWHGGYGAVVFLDTSVTGYGQTIGSANSLTGATATDGVGQSVLVNFSAGSYLVQSNLGGAGAITWMSSTTGLASDGTRVISAANSLLGGTGDALGAYTTHTNTIGTNYLISDTAWGGGKGSVTWMNGSNGLLADGLNYGGLITASNSLIGSYAGDQIGSYTVNVGSLTNKYLVVSPLWSNGGTATDEGAVTLGNATAGSVGVVSSTNSLVGAAAGDSVGSGGVQVVNGSTYLVGSPQWGSNGVNGQGLGAVTYISTAAPITGAVGVGNSLVGSTAGDRVGSSSNGFYSSPDGTNILIHSSYWNGSRGALTWMSSTGALADTTLAGAIGTGNSLLGSTAGDNPGSGGVTLLTNGNWVITSNSWGGTKGAVTWMNSATGQLADSSYGGVISATNSLVGSTVGDRVGGNGSSCGECSYFGEVLALSNGNYVVNSPQWQNGATVTGAITWANGSTGLVGAVSGSNSLLVQHSSSIIEASGLPGEVLIGSASANATAGGLYLVGVTPSNPGFSTGAGIDATVGAGYLASTLAGGTSVVLQANNDITVNSAISVSADSYSGASLTLQAGRTIAVNANITTNNGNVTLIANDTAADGVVGADRDPGAANLTQAAATTISAGTATVSLQLLNGAGNMNSTVGTVSQAGSSAILAGTLDVATYGAVVLNGQNQVSNLYLNNYGTGAFSFNNVSPSTSPLYLGASTFLAGFNGGSGSINITSTSDIVLNDNVSSSASGDAIVLATNGNFNDGGYSLTLNGTGRWLVYSTDPGLNSTGYGSAVRAGDFKQYGAPIGTTPAQTTGNGFLYSVADTISVSLPHLPTKVYDGSPTIALTNADFLATSSTLNGSLTDIITMASQNGTFNSKDVTTANTVTVNTPVVASVVDSGGATVYGYQVSGSASGTGSITPAPITAITANHVYDGTTTVNTTNSTFALTGLVTGESLTVTGYGSLVDKNVANGKSLSGVFTLGDGSNPLWLASNYVLTTPTLTANVTPRPLSTYTAGTSGVWNNSANWDVLPDGNNVLAVSIPQGVTVTFDNTFTAPVSVQTINSLGSLNMTGGTLGVSSNLSTANFQQSGGTVSGAGGFTVTSSFNQMGGNVAMTGPVSITQAAGNLVVGSVVGSSIALNAPTGAITQTAGIQSTGLLSTASAAGVTLTDATNSVAKFSANVTGGGVTFTNKGPLDVTGITVANQDVVLDNTGALSTSGDINALNGGVSITTHSPMTINGNINASGNIALSALTASLASNMIFNGNVISSAGGITAQAYNNILQNSKFFAALGINITAGGSITFGPGAFSVGNPVTYTANGVTLVPPWIAASLSGGPTSFVDNFLDQFQTALDAQQYAADDPFGKKQADNEGVVVDGGICAR